MSNGNRWSGIRSSGLNPPRRLIDWQPHVPRTPSADFPSHFLQSISAGTYHQVSEELNRVNNLIGTGRYIWPTTPRNTWHRDMREARQSRETVLRTVLQDISARIPSLRSFTSNFSYNPESFAGETSTWRAATGGWGDQPNNLPYTQLNDTAFSSIVSLNLAVRHEIWRQIERTQPAVFRGRWDQALGNWDGVNLRRFHAPLKDLEHRHAFALNPAETFLALQTTDQFLRRLQQGDAHWQRLTPLQRNNFVDRYEAVRTDVCHELRDTQFRTHPTYSRICGPVMGSLPWIWQNMRR